MSPYEEIVKREAKIAIIGMGYVGMPWLCLQKGRSDWL